MLGRSTRYINTKRDLPTRVVGDFGNALRRKIGWRRSLNALNNMALAQGLRARPRIDSIAQQSLRCYSTHAQMRHLPKHKVEVGPVQQNRLETHYQNALERDLLYMSFTHTPSTPVVSSAAGSSSEAPLAASNATATTESTIQRGWDPSSPYSKNRPARPNRGNRLLAPTSARYAESIVSLDRIVLTAFCKDAIANKHALIPLLAQMRAITGKPIEGSLADPRMRDTSSLSKHGIIRVLRAKTSMASFKLRRGMPVGVQVELPSKAALEFLEIFTTFVLPRLRTFGGFTLPPASQPITSPAAMSGVVSLGMGPEALGLFPQTEVNWDAYGSRGVGFQVRKKMRL